MTAARDHADRSSPARSVRRLLFVNRYYRPDMSATSQMLTDLTRALAGGQFELHVIASRQRYDEPAANLPSLEVLDGVSVQRVWSAKFGRTRLWGRALDYLAFHVMSGWAMLKTLRRGDVVVAMTDPPMISVTAALACRLRRAVLVNWLHDLFPEIAAEVGAGRATAMLVAPLRTLRDWSLRVAKRNVVLGRIMARRVDALPELAGKQQIIENWADGDTLAPQPVSSSQLRRSCCQSGDFVIEYSGNMGRAHEYATVLGAAKRLSAEPGWRFLFVGDGFNLRRLREEALRGELRNLTFLPYQPRELLRDSLAAGDIHLVILRPSLEGLVVPSKFYGILAAGRPMICIGDENGEQAVIAKEAGCGVAVRCGDSDALVAALRSMRFDADARLAAGARARALFMQRYTLSQAADKWRRLLDGVADGASL